MKEQIVMTLLQNRYRFVSGEEISQTLGVSRTAVWKVIKQLRQSGFEIESISNRGYRLITYPDQLQQAVLNHYLTTRYFGRDMELHDTIASTNTRAKELAQEGASHGTLVASEEQKGGRGRLGRSWESPPGMGIWMSLILRPSFPPSHAPRMTILAGLAVVQAIHRVTGLKAQIKWPNDIIIRSKKVCGILTEMQADPDLIEYVVVGIGLNTNMPIEGFSKELWESATSLKLETKTQVDRCKLIACILGDFEKIYDHYEAIADFSAILQEYKASCITLGRPVRITGAMDSFEGTAVDLTDDCELVVELGDGSRRNVLSGDVSVRGIAGYV